MMATLEELVGKAKAAPSRYVDVEVSLDAGVAVRIQQIEAELADVARDGRFTDPRSKKLNKQLEDLRVEAAGSLVTLRFTKLAPDQWAELTARSAARPDATIDLSYGYNYHQVCRQAAQDTAARVEGETVTPIKPETVNELLGIVSGNDFERIMSAVFDVNVWASALDLAAAKKASTVSAVSGNE